MVLDQHGPTWSRQAIWSKLPGSEPDFSIHETVMDRNGPFWSGPLWPEEVHFGPFGVRRLALWPLLSQAQRKSCNVDDVALQEALHSQSEFGIHSIPCTDFLLRDCMEIL